MKNRMRLAWQREFCEREGALWPVANCLQCNLHSCGWISDVGVLYKGIWLPAELHDIQLAPRRVSEHTLTCTHTHMQWYKRRQSKTEQRVIHMLDHQDTRTRLSQTDTETDTRHSKHAAQVPRRPCFVSPWGASQSMCPCSAPSTAAVIPGQGPIMAVNPADAPGTKQERGQTGIWLPERTYYQCFRVDVLSLGVS